MVRSFVALAFLVLSFPGSSAAQEVYGRVWLNQSGDNIVVAREAQIEIRCPAGDSKASWISGTASAKGTYRMKVKSQGRCDVRVVFQKQSSTTIAILVTRGRTRANLELVPSDEGWTLRKR